MPSFSKAPWTTMKGFGKYEGAVFIRAADGTFVGKAYGHDGQPAQANGQLMALAPAMREILVALCADGDKAQAMSRARSILILTEER